MERSDFVNCPLIAHHRLLRHRLHKHLIKCRRNLYFQPINNSNGGWSFQRSFNDHRRAEESNWRNNSPIDVRNWRLGERGFQQNFQEPTTTSEPLDALQGEDEREESHLRNHSDVDIRNWLLGERAFQQNFEEPTPDALQAEDEQESYWCNNSDADIRNWRGFQQNFVEPTTSGPHDASQGQDEQESN